MITVTNLGRELVIVEKDTVLTLNSKTVLKLEQYFQNKFDFRKEYLSFKKTTMLLEISRPSLLNFMETNLLRYYEISPKVYIFKTNDVIAFYLTPEFQSFKFKNIYNGKKRY